MKKISHITLPALLENLAGFTEPILECARSQGLEEKTIMKIDLAMEEILVNIINYSYSGAGNEGEIEVSCGMPDNDEDGMFMIEIVDTGLPFDVTRKDPPNVDADIDDRQIGGLGIYLVKQTMDLVTYQRKKGRNILQMGINRLSGR